MEENNFVQQTPEQPVNNQTEMPVQKPVQQPVYEQPVQPVYEQPVQPVYGAVPPAMPVADGGKKKGKGALLAVIAVVVILLLTAAGILVYKMVGENPKAKLAKGFANLVKEMEAYGNPLEEEIEIDSILEKLHTEAFTVDAKMNISVPSDSMMDTVGLDMTVNYDIPNKLMEAQAGVSMANIDMISMELMAEENKVYMGLPGLLTNSYFVNADTLGEDYNASAWAQIAGYTLDEPLSYEVFAEPEEKEELEAILEEELAAIIETMAVEDSGNVVEIERDGKTIRCDGVKVTFSKDALNDFMDAYEEELMESDSMKELLQNNEDANEMVTDIESALSARFKSDVEFCIYMDKKNRIVNIATPSKIKLENTEVETFGFSLVFSGTERALDEVSGTIKMESAEKDATVKVERTANLTKDTYENDFVLILKGGTLEYTADWNIEDKEFAYGISMNAEDDSESFSFICEGAYKDIVKGESVTLEIGEAALMENEDKLLTISGELTMEPFEGTIEAPSDAVDFFGMSESDITEMMEELQNALYQMMFGL